MKTFEPNKTIIELWINTKRKFVVVDPDGGFKKWEIITLLEDDFSSRPRFRNQYWRKWFVYLSSIFYSEELTEWQHVYVSDISAEDALKEGRGRILLRKCNNGYVCIQYGLEEDYIKGKTFETVTWKYAVSIQKKKTVTFEVTDEEDKYEKIREVVERYDDVFCVYWDKKILSIHNDWMMILRDKLKHLKQYVEEELHFEECTLSDLKENDVFVYTNTDYHPRIVFDVIGNSVWFYYLDNDVIETDYHNKIDLKVIKILRH